MCFEFFRFGDEEADRDSDLPEQSHMLSVKHAAARFKGGRGKIVNGIVRDT